MVVSSVDSAFSKCIQSNRRDGHGRKLLAAGTRATATLPATNVVTDFTLRQALKVFQLLCLACVLLRQKDTCHPVCASF